MRIEIIIVRLNLFKSRANDLNSNGVKMLSCVINSYHNAKISFADIF